MRIPTINSIIPITKLVSNISNTSLTPPTSGRGPGACPGLVPGKLGGGIIPMLNISPMSSSTRQTLNINHISASDLITNKPQKSFSNSTASKDIKFGNWSAFLSSILVGNPVVTFVSTLAAHAIGKEENPKISDTAKWAIIGSLPAALILTLFTIFGGIPYALLLGGGAALGTALYNAIKNKS